MISHVLVLTESQTNLFSSIRRQGTYNSLIVNWVTCSVKTAPCVPSPYELMGFPIWIIISLSLLHTLNSNTKISTEIQLFIFSYWIGFEFHTNFTHICGINEHPIRKITLRALTLWEMERTIFTRSLVYRLEICEIELRALILWKMDCTNFFIIKTNLWYIFNIWLKFSVLKNLVVIPGAPKLRHHFHPILWFGLLQNLATSHPKTL